MGRRASRSEVGRAGEAAAAAFLVTSGYRLLRQNVRFRAGELDLVAEEGGYLVFVEVKTRTGSGFGTAAEAVTPAKQHQLVRLAELYLSGLPDCDIRCRFDVVTVRPDSTGGWSCTLIRDAFSA